MIVKYYLPLKGATGLYKPVGGAGAIFCTKFSMPHIRATFLKYKYFRNDTLQAPRMKVTLIIVTKMFDNISRNMSLKINPTVRFKTQLCQGNG